MDNWRIVLIGIFVLTLIVLIRLRSTRQIGVALALLTILVALLRNYKRWSQSR